MIPPLACFTMNNLQTSGNNDNSNNQASGTSGHLSYDSCVKFQRRVIAKKIALLKEARVSPMMRPQAVSFPVNLVAFFEGHLRNKLSDVAMSKLEGLLALYLALSDVQSSTGFLAVLTLYAKTHNHASLVSQMKGIVDSLFDMSPQSSDRPAWLDAMTNSLTDWKLLVSNPAFKKVSRVISLLVTLGCVESQSINLGGLELFSIKAQERQVNAIDLADAVVETVVFFAEGAYQCFVKGSLKPLLFSKSEICEIEELYLEKLNQWEHVRNGNLKKFCGKDESEFDLELGELVQKLKVLYQTLPSGAEKKIVQLKWEKLSAVETEFTASRVRGGLRKVPFCVKVYGKSSVGKSSFTDYTMTAVLRAGGFPCDDDHICTLNPDDKHMSNYRSYITGIKIDDYGNTKLDYVEVSPTDWLIKIVNNIRTYAVMADLANKGKVTIEPACLTITTNVEDLHAGKLSYESVSIARRAHVHVDLKVKPEFCKVDEFGTRTHMLDSRKVFNKYGDSDQIQDLWNITIRAVVIDPDTNTFHFENVPELVDVDIHTYLNYLIKGAKRHFEEQEVLVNKCSSMSERLPWCERCKTFTEYCECCPEEEDHDPQFGERLATAMTSYGSQWKYGFHKRRLTVETKVEDLSITALHTAVRWFENSPYAVWTNWIPESMMDNDYVKSFIMYIDSDLVAAEIRTYVISMVLAYACFVMSFAYMNFKLGLFVAIALGLYMLSAYAAVVEAKKEAYMNHLRDQRGVLGKAFEDVRDNHVKYACGLFAGLSVLYGVCQLVKALRSNLTAQGVLRPRSVADIQERDTQVNVWKKDDEKPHVPSVSGATAGAKDALAVAEKAVWTIEYELEDRTRFSNCFAYKSGVILVPYHSLPKTVVKATAIFGYRKIPFILNPELVEPFAQDLVAVYVPNTGPLKDMSSWFANDYLRKPTIATILFNNDGKKRDRTMWQFVHGASNGAATFNGSYYELVKTTTFGGLCMAPLISEGKDCHVLGFHLGGIEGTKKGVGIAVTKGMIDQAVARLHKRSASFIPAPQAREIDENVNGLQVALSPDIHYKSPLRYIDSDCQVEVYGSVSGRSTYKSEVIQTPISDTVERVCGVANKHGPPRFVEKVTREDGSISNQSWKPWYASLDVSSHPSIGFDPASVDRAREDWLSGMREVFDAQSELWKMDIRPLSDLEVVSGIDGKKFIDAMPAGTSMGYPIKGPKRNHLIDLEPTEDHACPREFTPEIQELISAFYAHCDANEMPNQPFNASLKDEPTERTKEKVRVFQAAPVPLQHGIRKYFLPIGRFISSNPLVAECAVGINAHGPEWDELSRFMAHFGEDRIIAGDYSKYDLRMPAQLTISAFSAMIEIAKWSGNYTERDIKRMQVIAFEVCHPLIAYNGDMMRFLGTNPSGQNMTVYLNSVVNSFLHRLAFFDCYSQEELRSIGSELGLSGPAKFRDLVTLATYGDDAKGSVRKGYDKFNHVSMANFLEKNDMKFTMPDKKSEPVPFMSRYRADFLKRKDRFEQKLGVYVGVLEESSIFKSLHSILRSKTNTPEEVCTMNIEGAMREWFFHGEETYELRREQMKTIAVEHNLPVRDLELSFDDRVEAWKDKYVPQSGEKLESRSTESLIANATRVSNKLSKRVGLHDCNGWIVEMARMSTELNERLVVPTGPSQPVVYDAEDEISELTRATPVTTEDELQDQVVKFIGKPLAREYTVFADCIGKGDLLYRDKNTYLVIETKRIVGREDQMDKVRMQARKYASSLHKLQPNGTVYALTYTELGFSFVKKYGVAPIPAKWKSLKAVLGM